MGHKKKSKNDFRIKPQNVYAPVPKKKGVSTKVKILLGLTLIAIIVVVGTVSFANFSKGTQTSSQSQSSSTQQQTYPQTVSPVFYTASTLTSNGTTVTVPTDYVKSNKLVFVDLKLTSQTNTLPYNGRTVPLEYYKNGDYLPLLLLYTPSGNIVSAIRTCEPCGSFSFHIVDGSHLKCDVCGAEWNLNDFSPYSGGCSAYAPPKLTTSVGTSVSINLSNLPVHVTA